MSRISRNIGVTVPPAMAEEFEQLARAEQSSKSELFRRIFRFYKASRKSRQADDGFDAWVERAVFEAAEEKKANPLTPEEIRSLDERLLRYGAGRAEAAGIDTEEEEEQEEINRLIYAERQSQRAKAPGRA